MWPQVRQRNIDRSQQYWFAAIIVLGLVIRLVRLGAQSLWLDEMTSILVAQISLSDILSGSAFDNHTPPLYYAILHLWFRIFPTTEIGLRLPSALIDLLNMLLLSRLAGRWLPRPNAVLLVTAYALSPFMIYYSQEGRMYTLAVFFGLSSALALEKLAHAEERLIVWTVFSGILLASGLYTHYYFIFFGAALLALELYIVRRSMKHIVALCCSGTIAAFLFSLWLPVMIRIANAGGQSFRQFRFTVLPYTFFRFLVGYGIFPINMSTKAHFTEEVIAHTPHLALVFSMLLLLCCYAIARSRGHSQALVLSAAWLVSMPILIAVVISLKIPMLSERYFALLFPFFLLLTVGSLDLRLVWHRATACALLALFVFCDLAYFLNPHFGKAQWRDAAEYVSNITDNDIILVEPDYAADVFKYYFRKPNSVLRLRPMRAKGPDERFQRAVTEHSDIILVSSGRTAENGYISILDKIALKKSVKVFALETGITCTRWEIVDAERLHGVLAERDVKYL